MLGEEDVILDFLVRRDPPDEQEIHQLVVEQPFDGRATGRPRQAGRVDRNRQDSGRREAERFELLTVELGHAERQIDMADERRELPPRQDGEAEEPGVVRREIGGRRDVVVVQHAAAIERRQRRGHRRRQRVVQDRHVTAPGGRIAERPHLAFEVLVDRQREQLGLVAEAPQQMASTVARCRRSRRLCAPRPATG